MRKERNGDGELNCAVENLTTYSSFEVTTMTRRKWNKPLWKLRSGFGIATLVAITLTPCGIRVSVEQLNKTDTIIFTPGSIIDFAHTNLN